MALHFSRDTKVYARKGNKVWEIPVLDGFSFSQATNASEITLSEMSNSAGQTRRARQMFNDSYAPAEWSFQSYARPNPAAQDNFPAEDLLWAMMFSDSTYSGSAYSASSIQNTGSTFVVTTGESNTSTVGTFDLFFVMGAGLPAFANGDSFSASSGATIYQIESCVVNEASIDFEVDGITTINWSGFGKLISESAVFDAGTVEDRQTDSTSNFIRNRLTTLNITGDANGDGSDKTYDVTLTGGNLTFSNNLTYLTPETLGVVNQPFEAVTGTRQIGGNFTCYLGNGGNQSADLFEDLIEATSNVTNNFDLTFTIGGASAPKIALQMPNCHLELPAHSIEDVIALDTTFHALPSTIDEADELTITYTGA